MIEVVNSIRDNQSPWASSLDSHVSDRASAFDGARVAASLGIASVAALAFVLVLLLVPSALALKTITFGGVGFLLAAFAINEALKRCWDTGSNDRLRRRTALIATAACVVVLGVTLLALHSGVAVGNIEVASNGGLFLVGLLAGIMAAVAYRFRQSVPVLQCAAPFGRASRDDFLSHVPTSINPPPRPQSTRTAY